MLLQIITAISDFLWGTPMTVALVGTGLYLGIRFGFRYNFRKVGFNFRNTFGKMFQKGEGTGTVSGFAAACTAMANTIGVGNIGGVATAIVSGGPGAVFWMWVSGLLGMSTKACEIILGQRYRVKYSESMDEYMCDRSFVMKNALGWKKGAVVLSVACFVLGPWTCCVQTESVTSSLQEGFGIDPLISVIVLGVTCFLTIAGGLKRISSIMEKVVPIMALFYILGGLGILIMNWSIVPSAFGLIFKSAFSGSAAAGGFAGAGIAAAMRWGIARGTYSSEAGMGSAPIAHSAATTDHAVRQGFWGIFEVTVSAIIICTMTALVVLTSGVWTKVGTANAAAMPSIAFQSVLGERFGGGVVSVCMLLFVLSTVIVIIYYGEKQAEYLFGTFFSKLVKFGYIAAIFLGAVGGLEFIFQFLDFVLGITVIPNIVGLLMMSGKVVELKKEFFSDPRYYLKDTAKCQHEETKILIGNEE